MKKKFLYTLFLIGISNCLWSQKMDTVAIQLSQQKNPFNKQKFGIVTGVQAASYGTTLYFLNKIWYADYPKSSFHFYNDNGEWLKMDKLGHSYTAYQLSRAGFASWKWTGISDKKAILLASASGIGFQTIIETLDGFSLEWGWSWGDMAANTIGTGIWATQQLIWNQQRIRLKFSSHYNNYTDPVLEARTRNYFGNTFAERLIKDYNAQTYWLSANLHDFAPQSSLPKWLNIAVGYGAENMFGGYTNDWNTPSGWVNRNDLQRHGQLFISPDIDFEKIPTKSKVLKSVFFVLNAIKIPAPTLIISNGKVCGQMLYY